MTLRVQLERERLGFSKLEASRRCKISPATYGHVESGRYTPYARELERIAEALGWSGDIAALLEAVEPRA
jgi:transcriptional regulator with XRE-family HTH domain